MLRGSKRIEAFIESQACQAHFGLDASAQNRCSRDEGLQQAAQIVPHRSVDSAKRRLERCSRSLRPPLDRSPYTSHIPVEDLRGGRDGDAKKNQLRAFFQTFMH